LRASFRDGYGYVSSKCGGTVSRQREIVLSARIRFHKHYDVTTPYGWSSSRPCRRQYWKSGMARDGMFIISSLRDCVKRPGQKPIERIRLKLQDDLLLALVRETHFHESTILQDGHSRKGNNFHLRHDRSPLQV
jgi:hypothetical protein